jgi:hypothetical protein
MSSIIPERMSAQIDGDFVVFLIGMRINRPLKVTKWWPVFMAMPRMLRELYTSRPETGFLGHTSLGLLNLIQYWRSFEHLEAYARSRDASHWPAWVAYNRAMKETRGDVGIWHETYQVRAGEYETVYSGMPPFGLGTAGELVAASGHRESARGRMAGRSG